MFLWLVSWKIYILLSSSLSIYGSYILDTKIQISGIKMGHESM